MSFWHWPPIPSLIIILPLTVKHEVRFGFVDSGFRSLVYLNYDQKQQPIWVCFLWRIPMLWFHVIFGHCCLYLPLPYNIFTNFNVFNHLTQHLIVLDYAWMLVFLSTCSLSNASADMKGRWRLIKANPCLSSYTVYWVRTQACGGEKVTQIIAINKKNNLAGLHFHLERMIVSTCPCQVITSGYQLTSKLCRCVYNKFLGL